MWSVFCPVCTVLKALPTEALVWARIIISHWHAWCWAIKGEEICQTSFTRARKVCHENFSKSFKEGILKHAKAGIQKRPTPTERKREKHAILRECRKTVLAEDESVGSYQRKRVSQSFKKSPAPKWQKSHSPNFDRIEWVMERVLSDLKDYPTDKPINWSQFAREHGVPGSNGG